MWTDFYCDVCLFDVSSSTIKNKNGKNIKMENRIETEMILCRFGKVNWVKFSSSAVFIEKISDTETCVPIKRVNRCNESEWFVGQRQQRKPFSSGQSAINNQCDTSRFVFVIHIHAMGIFQFKLNYAIKFLLTSFWHRLELLNSSELSLNSKV